MTDERPVPGSDLEDRDALIDRVAEAFHGHLRNNVAAGTLQDYTRGARAVLALLEAEGRLRQPRRRPQPGETVIETEFARVVGVNDQLRAENERLRHRLLQGGTCCEHDPAEHTDDGCLDGWSWGPDGAVTEYGCRCTRKGVAS